MPLLIVLSVVLICNGCATSTEVNYAQIKESKSHLYRDPVEDITYTLRDVYPDCDDETCTFTVGDANILAEDSEAQQKLIDDLNRVIDDLVREYNLLVDALVECEYGKAQRDKTIVAQDDKAFRQSLISIGKQLALASACGILLY